jgi:hypothetical protein
MALAKQVLAEVRAKETGAAGDYASAHCADAIDRPGEEDRR